MGKKFFFVVFTILFLIFPVRAQEPDYIYPQSSAPGAELNIRIDMIRERRRAYTSLTDMHGLHILTPASTELERAYRELVAIRRQASLGGLFEMEQITLDASQRILLRAEELRLFRYDEDEVFLRVPGTGNEEQVSYIIFGIILLVLCVAGFLFANNRHKRKRERREDVSYSDFASARK